MWEHTITVSSAGKSLCTTGWKCGWSIGPGNLLKNSRVVHKENVETYITPIQVKIQLLLFIILILYNEPIYQFVFQLIMEQIIITNSNHYYALPTNRLIRAKL